MRKDMLIALLETLPDDADIEIADYDYYDTHAILQLVAPEHYTNWYSAAMRYRAIQDKRYVLTY